jgi:mono/diheme cytochrome c family protein
VRRLALIALLGALVAGCGGEETVSPTAETVEGEPPAAPQPQPQGQGNAAAGKQVFTQGGCGGCHAFTPAGTSGTTGPDLDELGDYAEKAGQPLDEFVRESLVNPDDYVEEGFPSGVMPAWSGNQQDLANLVAFLTQG